MTTKKSCLVIEDSDVVREIAVRIIADLGLETAGAVNAGEAIDHCRDHGADVVLLDWDLPSMGALDFLRGASDLNESTRPQIILCATENDPQQFTLAKGAGAAHHILKPFDRAAIATKLAEIGMIESADVEPAPAAHRQ